MGDLFVAIYVCTLKGFRELRGKFVGNWAVFGVHPPPPPTKCNHGGIPEGGGGGGGGARPSLQGRQGGGGAALSRLMVYDVPAVRSGPSLGSSWAKSG